MYFEKLKPTYKVIAPNEFDADDLNGNKEAGENFENFGVRKGENEDNEVSVIADTEQADTVDEVEELLDDVQVDTGIVMWSGRMISMPMRLIKEIGACSYEISLSAAEQEYYNMMWKMNKMALVSAGIGGGFINTNELHVMKYKRQWPERMQINGKRQ